MPYEKDVQERKWWWCPKWYWPFAVCSGIRTQHKWCYQFSWVKETRYGFVGALEGCENGKLYTWTRPVLGVGSSYYPAGEMCFDSSLGADEGRCDASRTGMLGSGLSASAPYLSSIDEVVTELRADVGETGSFDFSGEHKRLCQDGLWSYSRTLHQQAIVASVTTRFANILWYAGGIALTAASGTVLLSAFCRWPFPLLAGRSQQRSVSVRYEVQTAPNKSTLVLYNDPADGNYAIDIAALGSDSDSGKPFATSNTSVSFQGETCDFDPAKVAQLVRCIKNFRNRYQQKPDIGPPSPEPVFVVHEEIWRLVSPAQMELATVLVELMRVTARADPAVFSEAAAILANLLSLPDVSTFWSLAPAGSGHPGGSLVTASDCGCSRNAAALAAVLGVGLLAWGLAGRSAKRFRET